MSLGSYALGLAGADLPVFPLLPRSKQPRVAGRFVHGFHDATAAAEVIDRHWYSYPSDNIGVRVPLGMAVVDVDPRHGGWASLAKLQAEHGPLPETWSVRTGSGGRHLWYAVGEMALRKRLGERRQYPGIDVKSSSGYVVAPPSVHPDTGQRYEWLNPPMGTPAMAPRWLLDLMRAPLYLPPVVVPTAGNGHGRYSAHCLARRIECAPEGCRNITVYGAMRDAFTQGDLDGFDDLLTGAAVARGLSPLEVAGIAASVRRGSR